MSWGNKLKGIFFEEGAEEKVDEKQVPRPAQSSSSGTVQVPSQPVAYQSPNQPPVNYGLQNGVVDSKFRDVLEKLLEENNLEGIDFLEFIKAVKSTANIPGFTENIRYSSTFSTLKAASSKLDKAYLLQTADHYIKVLSDEEKVFDANMQKAVDSQVSSLQNQAKDKEAEIQKKREQMLKLQQEIEVMQGEINQLNMKSQDAQTQINFKAQDFKSSIIALRQEIEQNKQSIQTYIQ